MHFFSVLKRRMTLFSRKSTSNIRLGKSRVYVTVGGLAAVGYFLHWLYTRSEKRTLRREARTAALQEQMSVRDYVASYLEDPANKSAFMKQVHLVRQSWNRLKPNRLELTAHVMYQRLREEDPSTQEVFDQQLDWSSQERIFTIMIGNLISRLDDPSGEAFLDMLIRLGKRHHDLGVRPQQYVSMQRSILVSLEELLGAEWNRDYRDAWASVFSFISHVMIKAAAEEAQRVAREGKQEGGKGRGEGGEGGGEASHGEGRGKGCPITAPAHMPVNKVLSGLQLESIHTSHPDGHYLHRTPAKKG